MGEPKGYWISDGYSYIGIMPDGSRREFASREDFLEAISDEES